MNNFKGPSKWTESIYINICKNLLDTWLQMLPRRAVPVYILPSRFECAGLLPSLTAIHIIFKRKTNCANLVCETWQGFLSVLIWNSFPPLKYYFISLLARSICSVSYLFTNALLVFFSHLFLRAHYTLWELTCSLRKLSQISCP